MENLKVGDVVELKSGGPAMTIASISSDGIAMCNWFAGNQSKQEFFPITSLQLASEFAVVAVGNVDDDY